MKFTLESGSGITIRSYGPGHVTVAVPPGTPGSSKLEGSPLQGLETITASCIVTPQRLYRDWPPERFEELQRAHFEAVLALDPELVLFGSGSRLRFPAPELSTTLTSRGIGMEVMDTPAACRTFNILVAEGRNVAAALLMVELEAG